MNNWMKSKREEARAFDNLGETKDLLGVDDLRSWGMKDTMAEQITEAGRYSIHSAMSRHQEILWKTLLESAEDDDGVRGTVYEGIHDSGVWYTLQNMIRSIEEEGGRKRDYQFFGTPRVINKIYSDFDTLANATITSTQTMQFHGIPFTSVQDMPRDQLFLAHKDVRNSYVKGLTKPISILKTVVGERIEFQVDGAGNMAIEVYNE